MTAVASPLVHAGGALVAAVGFTLVLAAGRGLSARLLAAACAAIALWASAVALAPDAPLEGIAGGLEIARAATGFLVLLLLCWNVAGFGARHVRRLAILGATFTGLALLSLAPDITGALTLPSLGSPALLLRLALALAVVALAENLFRNAPEDARWHVNLPCIAFGGLGAFDVLLYADGAISHAFSPALLDARAALAALAVPLLAVASVRDRRWRKSSIRASRQVVFHGATLMVAGAFLLGVGAAAEALRRMGTDPGGAGWGPAAQASLFAGAALVLVVGATSRSGRSRIRHLIVDHFFTERYDYRREWLRCLALLSGRAGPVAAPERAIRAIADPVDSPGGVLLLREPAAPGLHWAGSWNLPRLTSALPEQHALLRLLGRGESVLAFDSVTQAPGDLGSALGPIWLAVPLVQPGGELIGVALLAPPRAPFTVDAEVADLLRAIGQAAALFLAERRAAEHVVESRRLRDYGQRFAFVAHDVKTVSSQLGLVLDNAEAHLQDPEFQRDMLLTVRAAVTRIDGLIARLREPARETSRGTSGVPTPTRPLDRLRALAAARPDRIEVEAEGSPGEIAISPENFDAAIGHLLNNAVEASPRDAFVRVRLRDAGPLVTVDVSDVGCGMTPEFIRDELFRPLHTAKPGGDGIGAWQARELLRASGGDLTVLSRPGAGTTMRVALPTQAVAPSAPERPA